MGWLSNVDPKVALLFGIIGILSFFFLFIGFKDRGYPGLARSISLILGIMLFSVFSAFIIQPLFGESNKDAYYFFEGIVLWSFVLFLCVRSSGQSAKETFSLYSFPIKLVFPTIVIAIGGDLISHFINYLLIQSSTMPVFLHNEYSIAWRFAKGLLLAPPTEELLFRGFILSGLFAKYSAKKAIFISSFLFMIFHVDPTQLLPAFIFGILASWVFSRYKSLWLPIFMHFASNGWVYFAKIFGINNYFDDDSGVLVIIPPIIGIILLTLSIKYFLTWTKNSKL